MCVCVCVCVCVTDAKQMSEQQTSKDTDACGFKVSSPWRPDCLSACDISYRRSKMRSKQTNLEVHMHPDSVPNLNLNQKVLFLIYKIYLDSSVCIF